MEREPSDFNQVVNCGCCVVLVMLFIALVVEAFILLFKVL